MQGSSWRAALNTILFWLWTEPGSSRTFSTANLNTVVRAISAHTKERCRYVCVTDDVIGLDTNIEVIRTPLAVRQLEALRSPEGARFPSCYRRLWAFSEEAAKVLGTRVLCLDIDHVPTGDYAELFARKEEFVGWRPYRDWGNKVRFGGGTYLLTPGTRARVWHDFKGASSIAKARAVGYRGSDQAWISYCLAETEPYFSRSDGIYSIRDFADKTKLPADARMVHFNGKHKPWDSRTPWVRQHMQGASA